MSISILFIDPSVTLFDPLCTKLSRAGFAVTCVNDRKSLIQLLPRLNPEIIIMDPDLADIKFPGLLFSELRETFVYSKFILMSGQLDPDLLLAAINGRVEHFFEKPVSDEALLEKISVIVAELNQRESLIQSEKHYKTIVQTAPDLMLLVDRTGTIGEINRSFLGQPREHWIGARVTELMTPETAAAFSESFDGILQTGLAVNCDMAIPDGDGSVKWFEARMAPIEQSGHIVEISLILRDITETKQYFQEIQQQNSAIQTLFEMGQQISSSLDLKEIFDFAYYKIESVMACDSIFLSSFDPVTKLIRAEYSRHEGNYMDVTVYPPLPLNPEGKGTQSRVILSGKALILNDYQTTLQTSKKRHAVSTDGKLVDPNDVPEDGDVIRSAIIIPIKLEGQVVGVIQVFSIRKDEYTEENLRFLEALSAQVAVASNNASLYRQVQTELDIRMRAEKELEQAYNQTLQGWVNALEIREHETAGHSIRVTDLMMKLADQFDFTEHERLQLWRGALLHDIGKLVIPAEILLKKGSFSDEEWVVMRQHGEYAYEWLSSIDYLKEALEIPRYHHEKWDGNGYPLSLSGEDIPLCARMFAVIDVYDALLNDRPYRKAWASEKVVDYIKGESGKHFDPTVVEKFFAMLKPEETA